MIEWIVAAYIAGFSVYGTISAVKGVAKKVRENRKKRAVVYFVYEGHADKEYFLGVFDNYDEAVYLQERMKAEADNPFIDFGIRWVRCEFITKKEAE
ncbi:hypothetical protein D7Z54_32365 [Salibacterium salarium]|uniref:Uncharacterized protein n=1 Tax=Salibacterium salarium TaxID=284579 RepID=A0A3R9PXM1_9BACI|nr:hypothetical protein [Salibacterium salarium]RSL29233.1 hypothetical protein D7Z54_32365 [Salibacterium salarium]